MTPDSAQALADHGVEADTPTPPSTHRRALLPVLVIVLLALGVFAVHIVIVVHP